MSEGFMEIELTEKTTPTERRLLKQLLLEKERWEARQTGYVTISIVCLPHSLPPDKSTHKFELTGRQVAELWQATENPCERMEKIITDYLEHACEDESNEQETT